MVSQNGGDTGGEKEGVVDELVQTHTRFQSRLSEYVTLLDMTLNFFTNLEEVGGGGVLGAFGVFMGVFYGFFGVFLEVFWGFFEGFLEVFWGFFEGFLEVFGDFSDIAFGVAFGVFLKSF